MYHISIFSECSTALCALFVLSQSVGDLPHGVRQKPMIFNLLSQSYVCNGTSVTPQTGVIFHINHGACIWYITTITEATVHLRRRSNHGGYCICNHRGCLLHRNSPGAYSCCIIVQEYEMRVGALTKGDISLIVDIAEALKFKCIKWTGLHSIYLNLSKVAYRRPCTNL